MTHSLPDPTERRCCKCPQTEQIVELNGRDYCPRHLREAMAEREVRVEKVKPVHTIWDE